MLEVAFSCPLCSRLFLRDCPFDAPIPAHLDALMGRPCPGSGRTLDSYLEIPEHAHDGDWLKWEAAKWRKRRAQDAPKG